MPTKTITHRGAKIFVLDSRECESTSDLKAIFDEAKRYLTTQPPSSVAMLTITNGKIRMVGEVGQLSKEFSKATEPYTRYSAIVGLKAAQRVLVKVLSPSLHVTDDEEEAKDWLAKKMTG